VKDAWLPEDGREDGPGSVAVVTSEQSTEWAWCSCGAQKRRTSRRGEVVEDWDSAHAPGCAESHP